MIVLLIAQRVTLSFVPALRAVCLPGMNAAGATLLNLVFSFTRLRETSRWARPEAARQPLKDSPHKVARDLRARFRVHIEFKFRVAVAGLSVLSQARRRHAAVLPGMWRTKLC